jgi:hypothetical protein
VIARDSGDRKLQDCQIADCRLILIEQILRFRLRISAEGSRSAAPSLTPSNRLNLDFFGNSGDFGNFLYLLWLLGV